jgi:hypothetical protein
MKRVALFVMCIAVLGAINLCADPTTPMPSGVVVAARYDSAVASVPTGKEKADIWSWVINDSLTGHLTFLWMVGNSAGSVNSLDRFTMSAFPAYTVIGLGHSDGGFDPDGAGPIPVTGPGGKHPGLIFADDILGQSVEPLNTDVAFDFHGFGGGGVPVLPGEHTQILWARTNVDTFQVGLLSFIDSETGMVESFAPLPEPASLLLLGSGLVTLASRLKRKKAV